MLPTAVLFPRCGLRRYPPQACFPELNLPRWTRGLRNLQVSSGLLMSLPCECHRPGVCPSPGEGGPARPSFPGLPSTSPSPAAPCGLLVCSEDPLGVSSKMVRSFQKDYGLDGECPLWGLLSPSGLLRTRFSPPSSICDGPLLLPASSVLESPSTHLGAPDHCGGAVTLLSPEGPSIWA